MIIRRDENIRISYSENESEAVKIAVNNLISDFKNTLGADSDKNRAVMATVRIQTVPENLPWEGFNIAVHGQDLTITGHDRRGTIYGIYTLSEMLGVSPWHWFADVPPKKRNVFELPDKFEINEAPHVQYRGIFINDEEELEHWVKLNMGEETIGVKTYEKIFELLLRLKLNYLWPAMHVNSFNVKKENGALAEKMGIVIGTSHCDMLMRSNNREWVPWKNKNGFPEAEYDWSLSEENRDILRKYWGDSIIQNKDFEVSFTLGMRGIHDSGFETRAINPEGELSEAEVRDLKTRLLEEVITSQKTLLSENGKGDNLQIFIPYKEVLGLYDNGLQVPSDVTLVWVNDNYGYIRRYPNEEEAARSGGNGIYYHNSYWAPPGNSYMFIDSIPLAHTRYELTKAYEKGIRKLWVTNFGTIKPLEEQMSYFADLAWETGKNSPKTDNVDEWLASWLDKTFTGRFGKDLAPVLNRFDQLTNVRKIEHLDSDLFPLNAYGDEGGHRMLQYEKIFETANEVYDGLPEEEKASFFQLVLMKIHAAYYSNGMYYFGDRSISAMERSMYRATINNTVCSLGFDRARRKMLWYYNNRMADGKWKGILTPEDFPPPRTAMYPACGIPHMKPDKGICVSVWGGGETLAFSGNRTKWIEIGNIGEKGTPYEIMAPEWLKLSSVKGKVIAEKRILISNEADTPRTGLITVICPETNDKFKIPVEVKEFSKYEEDERIVIEADKCVNRSEGAEILPRLGRGEGSLMSLRNSGDFASYRVTVNEGVVYAKLLIHRFPSLNSTGRIRARILVDGTDTYLYESSAIDEHTANWFDNVQNNGDLGYPVSVRFARGQHTITITATDPYFSFSRFVLFLGHEKRCNLALPVFGEKLPEKPEFDEICEKYYGNVELEPRKEIYESLRSYANANDDYDDYLPGEKEVPLTEWKTVVQDTVRATADAGKEILGVKFDAASAFFNTEHASIINDADRVVGICNSASHGGTGLAIRIKDKNISFPKADEAPCLNYEFEVPETKEYVLLLKLYMWGNEEARIVPELDGKKYPRKAYICSRMWTYSSEHTWKWYPTVATKLKSGKHNLRLYLLKSGIRVDRIEFVEKDIFDKNVGRQEIV